jgi:polar amino acid transport system substrate-binding protein
MNDQNIRYLKFIGAALAVVLILMFLTRGCSGGMDYFESEYTIGRDETLYPAALYGKEKNMIGLTNELILKIGEAEDFRVRLYNKGNIGLFHALESGEFDAIISAVNPVTTDKSRYLLSEPIYLIGPVLVMQKWEVFKTIDQLNGKVIAYRRGDLLDIEVTKYPQVVLRSYDSYAAAVQGLTTDRVDAILMDAIPAYNLTQGFYAGKIVVATKPLNEAGFRLITLKTEKGRALIDSFNAGLAKMKSEGEFKKMLDSWQLIDTEAPETSL